MNNTKPGPFILRYKILIPIIYLIIFFSGFVSLRAQDRDKSHLDSILNSFLAGRADIKTKVLTADDYEYNKCGLPLIMEIKSNFDQFTADQQTEISKILQRPDLDTSIISPSGFFRIHFNLTGTDVPAYNSELNPVENAMLAALAFDSSYIFEVGSLGYPEPPKDNIEDDRYDVYISNIGKTYGFCEQETSAGNDKYTSHIQIHFSFQPFYRKGVEGLNVTAAHEFHHAIQMGNYAFKDENRFFMELTSTSMEEFVFDDVNDYYQYLPNYFKNTSKIFSDFGGFSGYDLAIWNVFLADTLGIDIIKRQWELITQMNALSAINQSLQEYNTSFRDMLNQFGVWCFFTGHRSKQDAYFDEAGNYPLIRSFNTITFNPGFPISFNSIPPLSNTYFTIVDSTERTPDSITITITNSNVNAAITDPGTMYNFTYNLFDYPAENTIKLSDKYYIDYSPRTEYWVTTEMYPDQVIRDGLFIPAETDFIFPSPFYYSRHSLIHIPVDELTEEESFLNVYTVSMNLVYSSRVQAKKINQKEQVAWHPVDDDGNKLSTGIYIYSLKIGDKIKTGKFAIFNE